MNEKYLNEQINEFKKAIEKDSTLENVSDSLECLGHCPGTHLYKAWLFKYKDIMILLNDDGNGYYSYICCVNELIDNVYKEEEFELDKDSAISATITAYAKKQAVYLYPDKIIVKEKALEDCYLSKTAIIESIFYNSYDSFRDEVIQVLESRF